VRVLIALGDAQQALRDMPLALSAYQRAERSAEESVEREGPTPALTLTQADIELNIGLLHFNLRDPEKSIVHYNNALSILDGATGLDSADLALRKVRLFNNMAAVYVRRSDYTTALPYFQQALAMNRPLKDERMKHP
jgi:tetratricopeptide (TPR) repeat protein